MAQHLSPLEEVFYRTPNYRRNANNPEDRLGKLGKPVQDCKSSFCGFKGSH